MARLGFIVFGGMLALQSSAQLDIVKLGYLAGVVLCLLLALPGALKQAAVVGAPARWWLAAALLLTALLGLSAFVAHTAGTSATAWVRDAASYALFAVVPVIALDASRSVPRQVFPAMLVAAGLLGGLSWAVEWIGRRQILTLPIDRIALPSVAVPGMLYLFAIAAILASQHRRSAWAVVAGVVLALFLVTGTRSALLILVGPVAMAIAWWQARSKGVFWPLAQHLIVAALVVLAFQAVVVLPRVIDLGPVVGQQPHPTATAPAAVGHDVTTHLGTIPALATNPGADPSVKERLAQYAAAWALFSTNPGFGVGPGHPIPWVDVSGRARTASTADTPLVLLAKFGLLGVLVFSVVAIAYGVTIRGIFRRPPSAVVLSLIGFAAWIVITLPLGFPVEDKGTSLALVIVLAAALGETASATLTA